MMKRFFRTYKPFSRAGLQGAMAYRANFIFFLLGEMFKCFVMFFIWKAVFESSKGETFMGFTMENMVVYVFISFLTGYLSYSDGASALGEEIVDGSVSMRLIKPCSFDMCFLFQELGQKVVNYSIMFFPIVIGVEIYRYVITEAVCFNIWNFLLFLVSLQFAYLINFYFNVCYGFLAFFLKNLWGTNLIKSVIVGFLSGSTIPLAFMPDVLRIILTYMPFASLTYTPVMLYMGMYDAKMTIISLSLQLIWLLAFVAISKFIWKGAIKHLCVQGG